MKYAVFTSLTTSYIPNGRILVKSIKKIHPNWDFYLLFNDHTPPKIKWENEPFDNVVFSDWLDIPLPFYHWACGYSVVEYCTATKGLMSLYLIKKLNYDVVVYLDPDTMVFSPLTEVIELIEKKGIDVILTPHLTDREYDDYSIWSHEMAALKHGTFNLGFFVIANRQNGLEYLNWWSERLVKYSNIDFDKGLFTDQKWCNIAPYIFDKVYVLCNRAYNVATWNMRNRKITRNNNGQWLVNDQPLRFYHFSGFGHDFHWANSELKELISEDDYLHELWNFYKSEYVNNRLTFESPDWIWGIDNFGNQLSKKMRDLTHNVVIADPYSPNMCI